MTDKLIDGAGAREYLGGICRTTLFRLQKSDDAFPTPIKIGRRPFWRLSDLEAYIDHRAQIGSST